MAKKKSSPKKVTLKKVKPPARKAAGKPVAKAASAKKGAAKVPAKTSKRAAASPPAAQKSNSTADSLGRPLVTMEEKLYLLFHEDHEARSVFEFLQVQTVGDLIRLSPEEIIRVLTAPVRRTINRIRQRLAEKNRALQGDEEFTRQHQAKLQ